MADPKEKIDSSSVSGVPLDVKSQDDIQNAPAVGGLDFDEYTRGGLGRHLGVFSTIFLM